MIVQITSKIRDLEKAKNEITGWQKNGDLIVFTNGCFDILHPGHLDYLYKAKELGNKLVIGLNSDQSVKRIKGKSRPINNNFFRSHMLSSLFFVDMVVFFDEDTPEIIIKELTPDILVKGGDYEIRNIVGADYVISTGGKVTTLPFLEGFSTTTIINKIKSLE